MNLHPTTVASVFCYCGDEIICSCKYFDKPQFTDDGVLTCVIERWLVRSLRESAPVSVPLSQL